MTWRIVQTFQDLDVRVTVSESDHVRPNYSLSVWKINGEDVYRFFPVRFKGRGKIELSEPSVSGVVAQLWEKAEAWCLEKAQERENELIDEEIARVKAAEKPQRKGGTHQ